ncbi:MAG: BACON domain-containing protein [Alistipes sp.]|nr:BACON domain-containing protein [Alistipes sp.]MBQ5727294.1 BACON domain-containing protein [Alistipes sp.]
MKTNLWKSFLAVLAFATAFAFVGCTEDEPNKVEDPQIEISTATLSFTQAEESKTIDVTSNADWQVDVAAAADWITVTPAKGNGSKTVSVTVAENTTSKAREAVVKFQALHYEWGVWDTKTLTISQSASATEIETLSEIFNDNFDKVKAEKEGNYWPYFDSSYANPKGSGAEGVSYSTSDKNITVRANSNSDSDYSDYEGSGANNIFFGKTPNHFTIEDIKLPTDKDCYVLTFGSEKYSQDNGSVFNNSEFHVYISGDNAKWSEVEYAFEEGDNIDGRWNDAKASFKLAAVPAKLSVKFVTDVASSYRLDDVTLYTGGEGAQAIDLSKGVDLGGGNEPGDEPSEPGETKELTVTEAISAAKDSAVKVKESTVVAVSAKSYLLTDGTSYILAYKGDDPGLAVGDKVTVEGTIGAYRSVPQIANPVATKTGHVEYTHPAATVMTGADIDAYAATAAGETYIKYVKVEGELVKSGTYYNLTVEGASKGQGSISYPTAEMCPDSYSGKKVAVYGYTIYQTRDTDVNIIATAVEVVGEGGGDEPSEPSEPSEPGDEPGDVGEADVCIDFTNASNYPSGFPVGSANKIVDRTVYTFGGYTMAFAGSAGAGFYQPTGQEVYLLFGKKGAYVELPAIEGKTLVKVVATSRKGASASVQVGVCDTNGANVEGGANITWAQTEPYVFTYNLSGTTANTAYRLTVANDKNAQLTRLELYYE